jgi:hypothetical protein
VADQDPVNPEGRDAALVAELEHALATARQQQALLRSSLATVMGLLDRSSGHNYVES